MIIALRVRRASKKRGESCQTSFTPLCEFLFSINMIRNHRPPLLVDNPNLITPSEEEKACRVRRNDRGWGRNLYRKLFQIRQMNVNHSAVISLVKIHSTTRQASRFNIMNTNQYWFSCMFCWLLAVKRKSKVRCVEGRMDFEWKKCLFSECVEAGAFTHRKAAIWLPLELQVHLPWFSTLSACGPALIEVKR